MTTSQLLLISVSACMVLHATAIVSTRSPHVAPIGKCQPNETYTQCSTCEKTCANKNPICNKMCGPPKCQCGTGFYRSSRGLCVRMNDCENNSDNSTGTTCHGRNCPMGTRCHLIAPRCLRCRPIPMCIPMNRSGENRRHDFDDNNMDRNDRSDGMNNYNSVENDTKEKWMGNNERRDNYPRSDNGQNPRDNGGKRDNENENSRDWMNGHLGPRYGAGNIWQNDEKYPRHGDGGWNNDNQNAHDGDDNIQNPRNDGWNNDEYPRNGEGNNQNPWNDRWNHDNQNSRNNGNNEKDYSIDMDSNWNGCGSHNQRENQWGNQQNEWNTRGKREDDISENNTEKPSKVDDSQNSEKPSNEEDSARDDSA